MEFYVITNPKPNRHPLNTPRSIFISFAARARNQYSNDMERTL